MKPPFNPVVEAANSVIAHSHQLMNHSPLGGTPKGRILRELGDGHEELRHRSSRLMTVGLPTCKPTYPDGVAGWEADVLHAVKVIQEAADDLVEAAKALPTNPAHFHGPHDEVLKVRKLWNEARDDLGNLEMRLRLRVGDLQRLQTHADPSGRNPAPPVAQSVLPPAAPSADRTTEDKHDPDLTDTERAVLKILREQPSEVGLSAKRIEKLLRAKHIFVSVSTLYRHVLPKLAASYGVVNHRAAGGYLIRAKN